MFVLNHRINVLLYYVRYKNILCKCEFSVSIFNFTVRQEVPIDAKRQFGQNFIKGQWSGDFHE